MRGIDEVRQEVWALHDLDPGKYYTNCYKEVSVEWNVGQAVWGV